MPFMRGVAPIRRTVKYLEQGKLVFKDNIKIIAVNFNPEQPASQGAKDFVFWHFAQMQYNNPNIQMSVFHDMTPSPFLQFFFDSGKKIVLDVDSQNKDSILSQVKHIFCKTGDTLQKELLAEEKKNNPANFGYMCNHECICEIPGQVACPRWLTLPKELRGRHRIEGKDWEEDS